MTKTAVVAPSDLRREKDELHSSNSMKTAVHNSISEEWQVHSLRGSWLWLSPRLVAPSAGELRRPSAGFACVQKTEESFPFFLLTICRSMVHRTRQFHSPWIRRVLLFHVHVSVQVTSLAASCTNESKRGKCICPLPQTPLSDNVSHNLLFMRNFLRKR